MKMADTLDKLADTAALIAVTTTGITEINDDNATSALIGLAWDMRDELKKLSDGVLPNGDVKDEGERT